MARKNNVMNTMLCYGLTLANVLSDILMLDVAHILGQIISQQFRFEYNCFLGGMLGAFRFIM